MAGRTQFPLEQANVAELIAKVEARLRQHPEDGQGWDVIAPIYFKLGRFREAAAAYANAALLEGETMLACSPGSPNPPCSPPTALYARKNLTADDKALAELAALAKTLGLGS